MIYFIRLYLSLRIENGLRCLSFILFLGYMGAGSNVVIVVVVF